MRAKPTSYDEAEAAHHDRLMRELTEQKKAVRFWRDEYDKRGARIRELEDPGFETFLTILDKFLTYYPPDSIVCSDKPDADDGARFTAALRAAREIIRERRP